MTSLDQRIPVVIAWVRASSSIVIVCATAVCAARESPRAAKIAAAVSGVREVMSFALFKRATYERDALHFVVGHLCVESIRGAAPLGTVAFVTPTRRQHALKGQRAEERAPFFVRDGFECKSIAFFEHHGAPERHGRATRIGERRKHASPAQRFKGDRHDGAVRRDDALQIDGQLHVERQSVDVDRQVVDAVLVEVRDDARLARVRRVNTVLINAA